MFLHSLWRGGSTYVWSRFRADRRARAFYDPLNLDLAKLTRARLAAATPEASPHLRHPELSAPYFAEYAPLLRRWGRAGVAGFRRALAVERLVLNEGEEHPALEAYLRRLLGAAQGEGRQPVFGLTWSFGRLGWLAARFGGRHVHVDRAPEALFGSYLDQLAHGNPWFVARWLIMIEANRRHPWIAPLAERLPLREGAQRLAGASRKQHYRRLAGQLGHRDIYRMTFHAWALAALQGLAGADVVVDMNQLGAPRYRASIADRLAELTGLAVDFSDAHVPGPRAPVLDELTRRRVEAEVVRSLPTSARQGQIGRRLAALAPRKAALLASAI